jgi:hypothetical protein
VSHTPLQSFAITGTIESAPVQATFHSGTLDISQAWRRSAQDLVHQGATFESGGSVFEASIDGQPLAVLITLLRCPVTVITATFEMAEGSSAAIGRVRRQRAPLEAVNAWAN